MFAAIRRACLHVLPDKRESKSSGNGKHEITEQQKNHQSRQLIGFCHLFTPSAELGLSPCFVARSID